ncbi:hypothetical protein Tco_1321327 [Tanacetum coccineum]
MSSIPTNSYLAAFVFMINVVYFFSRSDAFRYSRSLLKKYSEGTAISKAGSSTSSSAVTNLLDLEVFAGDLPLEKLSLGTPMFDSTDTIMSDSEHSTVTYTSVSEDDSDIGSPGVDGPPIMPEDPYAYIPGPEVPPSPDYIPGPEGPPSPDYVPGPEEPEQAPPSPIYIPFVPEPVYPEFLPVDDEVFPAEEQPMPAADSPTHQSPGYIPESDPEEDPEEDDEEDPEEDPADYPADRGDRDDEESSDDDDDAEEEHLAPADPAAVAYSADQDPYLAYRRLAGCPSDPSAAPFHSEEVAERLLALTYSTTITSLSILITTSSDYLPPPLSIPYTTTNNLHMLGISGSRAAGI